MKENLTHYERHNSSGVTLSFMFTPDMLKNMPDHGENRTHEPSVAHEPVVRYLLTCLVWI